MTFQDYNILSLAMRQANTLEAEYLANHPIPHLPTKLNRHILIDNRTADPKQGHKPARFQCVQPVQHDRTIFPPTS